MATDKKPVRITSTKPPRRQRPAAAETAETPPAPEPSGEPTVPEVAPEAVAVLTRPETCVFCNEVVQVNPDQLEGGRLITEPSLGIRHFVCADCGDA